MKGHNRCAWLKVGETEVCGKSCCQEYCKVQLARHDSCSNNRQRAAVHSFSALDCHFSAQLSGIFSVLLREKL